MTTPSTPPTPPTTPTSATPTSPTSRAASGATSGVPSGVPSGGTSGGTSGGRRTIHIGHSPDPDDAFMWWPLANFTAPDGTRLTPKIDTGPYDFVHVLEDIQSLNVRSANAELEITALSIHQYPFVADQYALTSCGSSMGDNYGPMIIAKPGRFKKIADLKNANLAIPGQQTTAWLATQLLLAEHNLSKNDLTYTDVMFDQIIQRVVNDEFDAGLIIHEGQITYQNNQLECVADLGKWWTQSRKLPLPLGGNAIRRDLIESGQAPAICRILLNSINYALEHRHDAIQFALNYARDMESDLADKFVAMYVNKWTLDYGNTGRTAVAQLLNEARDKKIIPDFGNLDFINPA